MAGTFNHIHVHGAGEIAKKKYVVKDCLFVLRKGAGTFVW